MLSVERVSRYIRPALSALAVGVVLSVAANRTVRGATEVPVPTVTGPIMSVAPGDASHEYPFYAAIGDLKSRGYVEEEFFIEGTANRYNTPLQGDGSIVDGNHPYKTRIVVRRPTAAARFNGTAVIEWNNVTAGHDLDIDWFQAHDYLMRNGYAWVGVTPQRIGVEALKVWNAKRYGTLDVTHGGTVDGDALSYDIFAQAAQAIRKPGRVNVTGGLRVERMFATGHSQSAGRLGTYVNAVHPLAPIFDAIVLHGGGARIRTDLGNVKVWKLLSETDVLGSQAASRQPDSNNFRSWEVAGTSHVDWTFTSYSRQLSQRDGSPVAPGFTPGGGRGAAPAGGSGGRAGRGAATTTPTASTAGANAPNTLANTPANTSGCERPPYSRVPFSYVMNAAFDHLQHWVKEGKLPPSAPPIDTTAAGPPAVAARDSLGNALGGIRLSQHAVPTAVNTGQNGGAGFCRLYGSYEPFDPATLARLYPTHAGYVAAVKEITEKNLKAGYILTNDADATIAEADKAPIGK
jgi:hypothetical protein